MDSPIIQSAPGQENGAGSSRGAISAVPEVKKTGVSSGKAIADKRANRKPSVLAILMELKTLFHQSFIIGLSFMPEKLAYGIARKIGGAQYRRQGDVLHPLIDEISSGLNVTKSEAEKIGEKIFQLSAWRNLEIWRNPRLSNEQMNKLFEFRGLENLNKALERGKGVVLCTGHYRSLIPFFTALMRHGYKLNVVRRNALKIQGRIGRWLVRKQSLVGNPGINFVWMNSENLKAAVQVANALRRNEVVVITSDVRYGAESVPISFLRQERAFPTGHVLLSQATGAPLLNYFVFHPTDGHHQVVEFDEPDYPSNDGPNDAAQKSFARLEENIIQHPADWVWFQERELWKNPNE
jgi:KDO2-lipid IV(A) lauroyltransferase